MSKARPPKTYRSARRNSAKDLLKKTRAIKAALGPVKLGSPTFGECYALINRAIAHELRARMSERGSAK